MHDAERCVHEPLRLSLDGVASPRATTGSAASGEIAALEAIDVGLHEDEIRVSAVDARGEPGGAPERQ